MLSMKKIAISEAKCLGIPTFGIVDTNTDPNVVDYPIPANDDSIKTIKLILNYIAESIYNLSNIGKDDSDISDSSVENQLSIDTSDINDSKIDNTVDNKDNDVVNSSDSK